MASGVVTRENLPRQPTFDVIKKITDNFSPARLLLGRGSFGSVYKGILDDGGIIAVKTLRENSSVSRSTTFDDLLQNIMALEHKNIVKLLAYCRKENSRLLQMDGEQNDEHITETFLCYEFLPMGYLDNHLFGESSRLNWDERFKIIKGICEGIQSLHSLPKPILHLDLKPQNILLDDKMAPKITNFLFSRIFGEKEQSRMITQGVVGSVGYKAPEYVYKGEISARSDIYSLGLTILEITTLERNSYSLDDQCARTYIDKVEEVWTLERIMCEYSELKQDDLDQIEGCIKIGLECSDIDQMKRPSINTILSMLNAL